MPLFPGDPVPHFKAASPSNPNYNFGTVAGRYVVLAFLPAKGGAASRDTFLAGLSAARGLFDDTRCCFFGVLRNPEQIATARDEIPGLRWFFDPEGEVEKAFAMTEPGWVVLDPSLRVLLTAPLSQSPKVISWIAALPSVDDHAGTALTAPVLIVPRVFEPAFCRQLIDIYETEGGQASGFMREVEGRTVLMRDTQHKRRADVTIEDEAVRAAARARIVRRLAPEITRAFQFAPTRIERYIVAQYDGAEQGFFRAHRDNTTKGTAHRKFAVTINLNTGEYDGGDLKFPEFGSRTYRAPLGGAVVFSCSLLHEATPVTRGQRYAFLPFLYDDAGAKVREENLAFVDLNEREAAD